MKTIELPKGLKLPVGEAFHVGYKVLKPARTSSNFGTYYKNPLTYKPLQITKPKKGWGPLCVFVNKKAAISFKSDYCDSNYPIVKVLYKPSFETQIWQKGAGKTTINIAGKALADWIICLE